MTVKKVVSLTTITLFSVLLWVSGTRTVESRALPQAAQMSSADCLACHSDPSLTKELDGETISVHVDEAGFQASVHGPLDCTSCHSDVKAYPHDPAPAKVACGDCHSDAHDAYNQGLHAKAVQDGIKKAAGCLDCHGAPHSILSSSDPNSRTYRTNIPQTCGGCHGQKFVMEGTGRSAQTFFSYQESVHGRAVAAGSMKAAICTDCHKAHDIRSAGDSQSAIFKFNVPKTCGQCHSDIEKEYDQSIHGQAIARGNWQSPVCTDCHGIHLIKAHIDPTSSVANQALARTTCAQCHAGVKLAAEFGIAGNRISTYLDSYHGLASRLGSGVVANCASCHGIHNIYPSADPRSSVNKANLVATCGKCHPGASENFALSKVHLEAGMSQDAASVATRWVRWIYLTLIVVVIGGMLVHNAVIWRRKALLRRRLEVRSIVRMSLNQRVQHFILLISFFALAFTGFALKYPESWIATLLGSSEPLRRVGHRVAAAILLAGAVYHLGYLAFTAEGRKSFRDFLPKVRDLLDPIRNLRFYLGRTAERPLFGRFSYVEKAEYWAVIWGVLIMGVTGIMVWFKISLFGFLPRWAIDIALAIHFYEAILATLAIVVWHFYHVIFDPDAYPMNWSWYDGRVSAEHYRSEHPLDCQPPTREPDPEKGDTG
jgi:cytochrome b subunit of formate dehydrogenase